VRVIISLLLFHLAAHAVPAASANPTGPTRNSAGDISGLESALIGVGGAIIGGAVGGWFALLAAGQQSKRERMESRKERSRQAAMEIADAWPVLEEVLLSRAAGTGTTSQLDQAYNQFARTATTRSIPISDLELRRRIRNHVDLAFLLTDHNTPQGVLAEKVASLRDHGDAMRQAIAAHYNDSLLPAYTDPAR
jgi:gas vesicle protein